jgi:hypothetical protein
MKEGLHKRIRAELDRRTAVANAAEADAPSPWRYGIASPRYDAIMGRDKRWVLTFAHHYEPSTFVVAFAELHDPADALRRYAGELEVLERHHPIIGDSEYCAGHLDLRLTDCPELKSLASRLGIEKRTLDS